MTRDAAHHCTFCDLIHGAAEVSICHEDADAIAFMDIQPVNNGHVLVVPRVHYESLLDVPREIGVHLFETTMRLANAITSVSGCQDLNIVVSSGPAAGQDEPHFHVHIIPRREGDGFDVPLPFNGSTMPDRTVLDAYAARIIATLSDPIQDAAEPSALRGKDGPIERTVALPRFDEPPADRRDGPASRQKEAPRAAGQRRNGAWPVDEGAHGELQYDPIAGSGDAA